MPYVPLEVFANNPSTTVSSGGTAAPAQGTQETWTVASSASFPATETGATCFHVADPALPGEMITVTNVSGTTWTVTRGTEGSATAAHQAGFTVVQVVTAGTLAALQYPPWQFPVELYGAQGDGKVGAGGTGASGQAVFTDSGASFVSGTAPLGDVGKYIIINQGTGGSATSPFVGTITAVNSATSVNLSANLAAACASAPYVYGTDDTAAINAAVTAAASFATTHVYKAQVLFEPLNYMLGGVTQTTSPYVYNTQIPVPVGTQLGPKLCIDFMGVGDASEPDYWESAIPNLQGTCLISARWVTGQPDATYGALSVIGGPTGTTGLSPGNFANTLVNLTGITIVTPWNSQQAGGDFGRLGQANADGLSYLAFAPVNLSAAACGGPYLSNLPTNGQSVGFKYPIALNNDLCNANRVTVEGAYWGVQVSEHFDGGKLTLLYANAAIYINNPSAAHGMTIRQVSAENCNYIIYNGSSGGPCPVWFGMLDVEEIATAHIYDPGNYLNGTAYLADTSSGNTHPVVTGGANLTVYDIYHFGPGPWAGAPAAPGTGTAQQNTAYRQASIYLSATTITAVTTGPASTGMTTLTGLTQASGGPGIMVRVPPGHWWSAAYTGTLTAKWVLE